MKGMPFELVMLYSLTCRGPGLKMISRIGEVREPLTESAKGDKLLDTMCTAMEEERKRAAEENTLVLLLNLMRTQGWNAERAMTALCIPDSEKPLYARSVEYAISQRKTRIPATT